VCFLSLRERIHCGEAGDLLSKRFLREANVLFQGRPEFCDYALNVALRLGSKCFCAELVNFRFGLGGHLL